MPDKLHVLVAEDNAVNRIVIEGVLRKLHISYEFAHNGQEAIDKVFNAKQAFDAIFMDCEMPILNGFQAAEQIRAWEQTQTVTGIRIIALTGHVGSDFKQRALNSGMDYFINKPVDTTNILSALNALKLYPEKPLSTPA